MSTDDVQLFPTSDDVVAKVSVEAPSTPIPVRVVHGHLSFAQHPVVVGHYEGDVIVGAEADLDRVFDRRLSEQRAAGTYPGAIGSKTVILGEKQHPGVIVAGLGSVGRLSSGALIRTLTDAVVAYAEQKADGVDEGAVASAPLSSVIVGSGSGGLSVNDAIAATLRAVDAANEDLASRGIPSRVDTLDIIELFEDRSVEAAHALNRICESGRLAKRFVADGSVASVSGGRRRVGYGEREGWWRRLQIRQLPGSAGTLEFTVLTDRARATVSTVEVTVDDKVRSSIERTTWNEALARELFEGLLPEELREAAPDERDLVLVVDERAARYPWEMLHDALESRVPLAVRAGVIRQLVVEEWRPASSEQIEHAALVVGDPKSNFPPLPAAKQEATDVADLLDKKKIDVHSLIESDAASIRDALEQRRFRMLHLAGHGVYKHGGNPENTGMVIGDGEYLTAAFIEGLDYVPEFVFINCCHLGYIEGTELEKLAANISTQLIRMGVHAVVAAGWAVIDDAAKLFADTLYDALFADVSFGQAVKKARETTQHAHPKRNTWAAYQCYGDPAYVLTANMPALPAPASEPPFVSVSEALAALENFKAHAKTSDDDDPASRLGRLVNRIDGQWRDSAALEAALGAAYGELRDYASAVAHYERALLLEDASCDVRAAEQRANLRVRWADQLIGEDQSERDPRDMIETSIKELETLIEICGETSERTSLVAASHRRRLKVLQDADEITDSLGRMVDGYRRAFELTLQRTGVEDNYPLNNWLSFCGALAVREGTPTEDLTAGLEAAWRLVEKRGRGATSFWEAVGAADALLAIRLIEGDVAAHEDAIVEEYAEAMKRASSKKERGSVDEHLSTLIWLLSEGDGDAGTRELQSKALANIKRHLAD